MSRSTRKSNRSSMRKTKKAKLIPVDLDAAGKPIAAGGFGCVFLPRLTCEVPELEAKLKASKTKFVSKLMMKSNANDEEIEMEKVLTIVNKLPSSSRKYFILHDTTKCKPALLSPGDKEGFNRKCTNLTREGIDYDNVNNNLTRLRTINVPFGGDEVSDLFRSFGKKIRRGDKEALQDFMYANLSMIDVLEKAIVPMNKAGLLHHDLKGQNMLIDKESLIHGKPSIKIIDWGLAIYADDKNPTNEMPPAGCRSRPFQFNLPFGVILLSQDSVSSIEHFCRMNNGITRANVKSIASKLIKETNIKRGQGHYNYIMELMTTLTHPFFNRSDKTHYLSETDCYTKGMLGQDYIVDYISDILLTFSQERCSDIKIQRDYFPIYRHNCDIWGFLMAYQDIIAGMHSFTVIRSDPIAKQISNILMKYCYSTEFASKKIDVSELVRDLKEINVVGKFKDNRVSPVPSAPKQIKPPMPPKPSLPRKANTPIQKIQSPNTVSLRGKKRCPKGYMKVKGTTKCRKKGTTQKVSRKTMQSQVELSLKGKKRCPTGKCRKTLKTTTKKKAQKSNTFPGSPGFVDGTYHLKKGLNRCPKGYKKLGTLFAPGRPSMDGRVQCMKT